MKLISIKNLAVLALLAMMSMPLISMSADEDPAVFLAKANSTVAHASAFKNTWDGPTTGPKLAKSKFIVFIGSDLSDPGMAKIASSLKEVTASVGWTFMSIDCYNIPSRRAEALSRAIALKPAGIIFAGADAKSEAQQIGIAASKRIPVIGWHAALTNGPGDGLFTNIGTDPKEAGQLAALLSIVESEGKAGAVVIQDISSTYLAAKSLGMMETIKQCQTCTLLSVEQVTTEKKPIQVVQRIYALQIQFAARLGYILSTNDTYFDELSAKAANEALGGQKFQAIAAGNGSPLAYDRIRNKKWQIGTVPEPLIMQAWQMVDEINRALAGEKPSGYQPEAYIVTRQNLAYHGGQNNVFDPNNGYQDAYKKIWGR